MSAAGKPDRRENGTFAPGNSANPGGRPKGLAKRIREIATPDQLADFYLAVFDGDEKKVGLKITLKDRMEAGNWLADRGYGKAAPLPEVKDDDPLELAVEGARDALTGKLAPVVDISPRRAASEGPGVRPGANGRNGKPH